MIQGVKKKISNQKGVSKGERECETCKETCSQGLEYERRTRDDMRGENKKMGTPNSAKC